MLAVMILLPVIPWETGSGRAGDGEVGLSSYGPTRAPCWDMPFHSPILIENETSLLDNVSSEGWPGSGTDIDPYVISDYTIDGKGGMYCILLSNLSSSVMIRNCTLWNASMNIWGYQGSGLELRNMSTVIIHNNTVTQNYDGIRLEGENITVTLNSCLGNSGTGLDLMSDNVTAAWNTIKSGLYGIRSVSNANQVITNNSVGFVRNGIVISACPGSRLHDNTVFNSTVGIEVLSSSDAYLADNRVENNTDEGIRLESCTGATLNGNYVFYNSEGVYISNSRGTTLSGNTLSNSTSTGLYLIRGRDSVVSNNTIRYSGETGIYLYWWSDGNRVLDNDLYRNGENIYCRSADNVFVGNELKNGINGIKLENSEGCRITGNLMKGNVLYGVYMLGSRQVLIGSNEMRHNNQGVNLDSSPRNTISENDISHNRYGISLLGSAENLVYNNSCYNNSEYGMVLSMSNSNLLRNNSVFNHNFQGIRVLQSNGNLIYNNSLLYNRRSGNSFDPSKLQCEDTTGENMWYSLYGWGNYWRDHRTPDNDSDGVVDVPYPIQGSSAIDLYPHSVAPFPVLAAPPPNLTAGSGRDDVELRWEPPEAIPGSPVYRIKVHRAEGSSDFAVIAQLQPDETGYTDLDVTPTTAYKYRLTAVNGIGESPPGRTVSALPDDTGPEVSILSPLNGSYQNRTDLVLSWTGSDPVNEVSGYELMIDEGGWEDLGLATQQHVTDLEEGTHTISVRCRDEVGNTGIAWITLTVDLTSPVVDFTSGISEYIVNSTDLRLEWDAHDAISGVGLFQLKLDGLDYLNATDESHMDLKDLEEGIYDLSIVCYDLAGNSGTDDLKVIVDTTPPSGSIQWNLSSEYVNRSTFRVSWAYTDGISGIREYGYRIVGSDWISVGTSTAVELGPLDEGDHTFSLRVLDRAENRAIEHLEIVVDTFPPVVLTRFPEGEQVPVNANIEVQFSETMDRSRLNLAVPGVIGALVWEGDRLEFDPAEPLEYDRQYEVTLTCGDLAGNGLGPLNWSFRTTDMGSLKGRVLDEGRFPLKNVEIVITGNMTTRTDAEGRFGMDLHAGAYTLMIRAPGLEHIERDVTIEPGSVRDLGSIYMEREARTGRLLGSVVDKKGEPILGVIVTSSMGETATTDENGRFEMALEEGIHLMTFARDGYHEREVDTTITKDNTTHLEVVMEKMDQEGDDGGTQVLTVQLALGASILIIGMAVILFMYFVRSRATSPTDEE